MTKACNIGLISVRYNLFRKVYATLWLPKISEPGHLMCYEVIGL